MERRQAVLRIAAIHTTLSDTLVLFESEYGPDIPTSALGRIGLAFVDHVDEIELAQKVQIFAEVEELLACEDESVVDAVSTGFLEAVVNRAERHDRYNAVAEYFGTRAREYVEAWNLSLGITPSSQPLD